MTRCRDLTYRLSHFLESAECFFVNFFIKARQWTVINRGVHFVSIIYEGVDHIARISLGDSDSR